MLCSVTKPEGFEENPAEEKSVLVDTGIMDRTTQLKL